MRRGAAAPAEAAQPPPSPPAPACRPQLWCAIVLGDMGTARAAAAQLGGERAGRILPEVLRPRNWAAVPKEERQRVRRAGALLAWGQMPCPWPGAAGQRPRQVPCAGCNTRRGGPDAQRAAASAVPPTGLRPRAVHAGPPLPVCRCARSLASTPLPTWPTCWRRRRGPCWTACASRRWCGTRVGRAGAAGGGAECGSGGAGEGRRRARRGAAGAERTEAVWSGVGLASRREDLTTSLPLSMCTGWRWPLAAPAMLCCHPAGAARARPDTVQSLTKQPTPASCPPHGDLPWPALQPPRWVPPWQIASASTRRGRCAACGEPARTAAARCGLWAACSRGSSEGSFSARLPGRNARTAYNPSIVPCSGHTCSHPSPFFPHRRWRVALQVHLLRLAFWVVSAAHQVLTVVVPSVA